MDDPLSLTHFSGEDFAHVVEDIHAYMHELGMAPIREGLHILGQAAGRRLAGRLGHDAGPAPQRLGPQPARQRRAAYGFDVRAAAEGARRARRSPARSAGA